MACTTVGVQTRGQPQNATRENCKLVYAHGSDLCEPERYILARNTTSDSRWTRVGLTIVQHVVDLVGTSLTRMLMGSTHLSLDEPEVCALRCGSAGGDGDT